MELSLWYLGKCFILVLITDECWVVLNWLERLIALIKRTSTQDTHFCLLITTFISYSSFILMIDWKYDAWVDSFYNKCNAFILIYTKRMYFFFKLTISIRTSASFYLLMEFYILRILWKRLLVQIWIIKNRACDRHFTFILNGNLVFIEFNSGSKRGTMSTRMRILEGGIVHCYVCGKNYSHQYTYHRHKIRTGCGMAEKPSFPCPFPGCTSSYKRSDKRKAHFDKVHTNPNFWIQSSQQMGGVFPLFVIDYCSIAKRMNKNCDTRFASLKWSDYFFFHYQA